MSDCTLRPRLPLLFLPLLLFTPYAWAKDAPQESKAPVMLRTADFGKWEQLGGISLSSDGNWLVYTVSRNDGESKLHLRALDSDKAEIFDYGTRPRFGEDCSWLAFSIGVSEKEKQKQKKLKKPVRLQLGLHDLSKGKTETIKDIESFTFSDDGRYLVMRRYKSSGQKHGGRTILVRDRGKVKGNTAIDRIEIRAIEYAITIAISQQ
jgi:hypothetical protein